MLTLSENHRNYHEYFWVSLLKYINLILIQNWIKKEMTGQSKPKQYACDFCPLEFIYLRSKQKHQDECTYNPFYKGYGCKFCLLEGIPSHFKSIQSMKNHITLTHSAQKKPRCSHCDTTLSSAQSVRAHEAKCKGLYQLYMFITYFIYYVICLFWTQFMFVQRNPNSPF